MISILSLLTLVAKEPSRHPSKSYILEYISIHATLAGVLNMSGAGRFFDELLDKYKDDEGNVPAVRS